jgi:hypothetical protein
MSAIIRSQLTVILTRLIDETALADRDRTNPPQNSNDAVTLLLAHSARLERSLVNAQSLLDRWGNAMLAMADDVRAAEEQVFLDFKVNGMSPSKIVDDAGHCQTELDIKADRLRVPTHPPPTPPPTGSHTHILPNVRLPPLQLPDFDGTENNWPAFWAAFEHSVHN